MPPKSDTQKKAASDVVCENALVNIWNMEMHQKEEHGLESREGFYRCKHCECNSYNRWNIMTHMQSKYILRPCHINLLECPIPPHHKEKYGSLLFLPYFSNIVKGTSPNIIKWISPKLLTVFLTA